jgi:outer membrane lipase/esterase
MISMLAEAPVATRNTLVRSIRNQIPVSQHSRGKGGFNVWLAGDVSSLRISNAPGFPDDPGTPVSLTAGFDYKLAGDNLIGVALTVGRQQADFSAGFGNFTQKEFAASVYFAGARGPVWFDTIATYGWLDNRIARTVPVGITVQDNSGSAAGSNVSLAGDIGYDFRFGAFTHGPRAGITLQQVRIDGFTETGSFTSLAFGSQTRNSAVGHLGYQVSYQTGAWRPFARAAWDHELASTDRSVTASLTTIAAPSYSMPAVTTGRDWADVTAGATVAIADNLTGLIAVNGIMSRRNVAAYGGELGLNIAF